MTDDFPAAFLETLREIFGDVDEILKSKPEHISRLHRIWGAAQDDERRAACEFMREQFEQFEYEDKQGLVELAWFVGNGTYRTTPDLATRPWWVPDARRWRTAVGDSLEVKRSGVNQWAVRVRETDVPVALISKERDGAYRVWHHPRDPAEMADVRQYQTWTAATQDVAARQAEREFRAPRAQNAPEECKTFGIPVQRS